MLRGVAGIGARFPFALLAVWLPVSPIGATEFNQVVAHVVDGDTFDLVDGTRIRVCGIDAPEDFEPGFQQSAAALEAIIQGRAVRCVQVGGGTVCDGRSKPTNGNRVVAQCFVNGKDIAEPMVDGGFACDWKKFSGGAYLSPGAKACP